MLWVLLFAVAPDTYAVAGIFPNEEQCVAQLEVEFDKCWSAALSLQIPEGEKAFIVKPTYDY
jgi:hypothetical protein